MWKLLTSKGWRVYAHLRSCASHIGSRWAALNFWLDIGLVTPKVEFSGRRGQSAGMICYTFTLVIAFAKTITTNCLTTKRKLIFISLLLIVTIRKLVLPLFIKKQRLFRMQQ